MKCKLVALEAANAQEERAATEEDEILERLEAVKWTVERLDGMSNVDWKPGAGKNDWDSR